VDIRKLLILFLLWVVPAFAQTTTVTGTIVDPNGNPYSTGTASAAKVVAIGQNPGTPVNTVTSNLGVFSMTLSSPASYTFTICAPPTQIGPTGNPTPVAVCFSNPTPIAISGASQDVSAALNPSAKVLGPNFTTINAVGLLGPGNIVGTFGGSPTMNGTWTFANPIVGGVTGNAGTATALASVPGQCGANSLATGVTAAGAANCTATPTVNSLTVNTNLSSNGGGMLAGTYAGNRTDTGMVNENGTFNANGNANAGNVPIKYASASAYRYVDGAGSDTNDGLSPGTAKLTIAGALLSLSGTGTIDVTGSITIPSTVTVGNNTGTQVGIILEPGAQLICSMTGGTDCIDLQGASFIAGQFGSHPLSAAIITTSGANISKIIGMPSTVQGPSESVRNLSISVAGTATVGDVLNICGQDQSNDFSNLVLSTNSPNVTNLLHVSGLCGGSSTSNGGGYVANVWANCAGLGSCTPVVVDAGVATSTATWSFRDIYPENPGTGAAGMFILKTVAGAGSMFSFLLSHIHTEQSFGSTVAIPGILVDGVGQVVIDDLTDSHASATSGTGCALKIQNTNAINFSGVYLTGGETNFNGTISSFVVCNAVTSKNLFQNGQGVAYEWNNSAWNFAFPRYFDGGLGISTTAIANNSGLQLFNTTTTCSTSGVIDNTCTTAAITLPVAEPDTSYRVVCIGKSPTNVPVVITTTNLNASQFTITIASLTAAIATFASYDCTVGHN
jgi:hypothetical protein